MTENPGDSCPYCGTMHPMALRERAYYRCHGCNFFVHETWLVDEPELWILDAVHRLLCPWCGFPAGSEQEILEGKEVACGGCAGSLSADILVTQADLRTERDHGQKSRNLYLIFSLLIFVVILILVASQ